MNVRRVMGTEVASESRDTAFLRDVGALLSRSSPSAATFARLCKKMLDHFGGNGGFVASVDRRGTVRMECLWEDDAQVDVSDPLGPPQTNTSRVAATGKPLMMRTIDDWIVAPWTPVAPDATRLRAASALFVPVVDRDRTVAVLSIQSTQTHLYDEHALQILETVARYLAVAMRYDRAALPGRTAQLGSIAAIVVGAIAITTALVLGWLGVAIGVLWLSAVASIVVLARASTLRRAIVAFGIDAAASERERARRESVEEQVRKHAFHDPLTGLPNRAYIFDLLEGSLTRARISDATELAVLMFDIDGFSELNETLGHRQGDELLIAIARRLERALQANDVVARIAADAFVVVLKSTTFAEHARVVAERIARELGEALRVGDVDVRVTASIGIATCNPAAYGAPGDVLRDVEHALAAAKAIGNGSVVIFDPNIHGIGTAGRLLERDLRKAIASGEMRAHYQPIVDMTTRDAIGWEALIRWQHPERGLIAPGEFIPIAERTTAILDIGNWMIETAAAAWASARPHGADGRPRYIAVNISARHLIEPAFLSHVRAVIARYNLPVGALKIELTESLLLDRPELASSTLAALAEAGVASMIDDFGTGYSSLNYLRRLPLETLKIDQSFTSDLTERPEAIEIVRTIVSLATTLRLSVTAEGIETEEQFDILYGLGVRAGQGYLFARPSADAIAAFDRTYSSQRAS